MVLIQAMILAVPSAIHPRVAVAAVALPPGFSLQSIATGQPDGNLTNFEFLPGGGVLMLGRNGLITVSTGGVPPRTLASLPGAASILDLGALGLTLARDYAVTGKLYTFYARDAAVGRVARVSSWTASPPVAPTSLSNEHVILESPLNAAYHAGGTVLEALDGSLLVSLGDNASPVAALNPDALRAQSIDGPYGKVLRVSATTGAGMPGNPFYSASAPSSWRSRTYAYGLRNPFRISPDPRNGRVLVGDVGWTAHEEIDVLVPGANYGWPCYEGPARVPTYQDTAQCRRLYTQRAVFPLWTYPSPTSQSAVVSGDWYTGSSYPAMYRQAYFFADYAQQRIWSMVVDANGHLSRAPESVGFASGIGAPVAMKRGPNGDLYFADILSSTLVRLRYSAGNRAPVPQPVTTVEPATLTARFDGSASYDLDGDPMTYQWDFGDGRRATGAVVSHTYSAPGTFSATLTVRDPLGASGTTTIKVVPSNHAPELSLRGAVKKYAVGDLVSLSATAGDVEDGALQVSWRVDVVHCDGHGGCHLHPGLTSSGPTFAGTVEDHGEDTRMRVTASAVDSVGVRAQQIYVAEPDLRTLSVISTAPVLINGITRTSAKVVAQSRNDVAAPAAFGSTVFTGWSDGGARVHALTMPAADLSLTARFSRVARGPSADYDGDGRTDLAVYRPQTATWWDRGTLTRQFGAPGDVPIAADLNADGRSDLLVWRPRTAGWLTPGLPEQRFGQRGDVPLPGDYGGNVVAELAVWRPSTGVWWIRNVGTVPWGRAGDVPVPGDYNGDGKLEAAVWRPSTGNWWIRGRPAVHWGQRGDVPVAGDFNGDRRTDLAIWRPSTGAWWILGQAPRRWGVVGDKPLTGDFNGDRRTDLAVWRPSTGTWWVLGMPAVRWGVAGDQPLPVPLGSRS